jgi:hypothetical protein
MAFESLADFFALHYGCNNRDIIKAAACCARGPCRKSLHKAAMAWRPESTFHRQLRQLMLTADQPRMYGRINLSRSTPASAYVHKELKAWLRKYYPPPKPKPPPKAKTLLDIFNATDRYSKEDIKGGIWLILNNGAWQPVLQRWARWNDFSEARRKSVWERELIGFILADPRLAGPTSQTLCMYTIAKRIVVVLKNSPYHYELTLREPAFSPPWKERTTQHG